VVLDETEDENLVASESEPVKIKRQNSQENENSVIYFDKTKILLYSK